MLAYMCVCVCVRMVRVLCVLGVRAKLMSRAMGGPKVCTPGVEKEDPLWGEEAAD